MFLWNQNRIQSNNDFVQNLLAGGSEIYGVVLNDKTSLGKLGEELSQAPYKAEPKAPAMYIKPRNTIAGNGAEITLPTGENRVEIGAVLGLVIGKSASRVTEQNAMEHIAGFVAVADLSLPHNSYYRPAIYEKCFDGACPVGEPVAVDTIPDVHKLEITTTINGQQVAHRDLSDLHRSIPQLISDVSEFMTLSPGDILLTGVMYQAPQAKSGDTVQVKIDQVGTVEFSISTPSGAQI